MTKKRGIVCPKCDSARTRVDDTRHPTRGLTRRYRVCDQCGQRFVTVERFSHICKRKGKQ